ncbi:MAG TPA: metallophosphoesterase [Pirellulaceae bacterium]|nr:metallophosphoesterase [Pirellulaceae bacterium]
MAPLVELALTAVAFIGHFSIAVWLFNRLHAVALPRRAIKVLEKLLLLTAAGIVAVGCLGFAQQNTGWQTYLFICWLAAAAVVPCWLIPKLRERTPAALLANDTTLVDVAQRLGFRPVHGAEAQFFARIPGNELLRIAVQRKTLRLPNLPSQLDGLTIAHISDLHMTGQLGREFYDCIVDESNALSPDLVVITGDILEKERCLPLIKPTLGRLQARHGKQFILGNHETRLADVAPLRRALVEAGLTDLGGRCQMLAIRGTEILIAGTELPWFGAAPDIACETPHFRLLLSHSPDQLPWARSHGFDLVLAGHNHGGQIRLPYLGALITPSWYGFRYAGGLYFEPPTLLHVSRGLAGIHPIRLNCPPELALLTLKSA